MECTELLDATSVSGCRYNLTVDGTIITGDGMKVSDSKTYGTLTAFNGDLYASSGNTIYKYKNDWKKVVKLDYKITHTSTTGDGNNLWVQGEKTGDLFDTLMTRVQSVNVKGHRNYGVDKTKYVDMMKKSIAITSGGTKSVRDDIVYADYSNNGRVVGLQEENMNGHRKFRIVNDDIILIR